MTKIMHYLRWPASEALPSRSSQLVERPKWLGDGGEKAVFAAMQSDV